MFIFNFNYRKYMAIKKKNILDFAGLWSNISDEKWKEIEDNIREVRKSLNESLRRKIKRNNL